MQKVTVLYGHPEDRAAFEKYYTETHTPIALKIPNLHRLKLTVFSSAPPGGSKPAYYRMTKLYFADAALPGAGLNSTEGQDAANDLQNFATGGATFIIGTVE